MNHSMFEIAVAAIAGFALGTAYFGTLWLTVRHAMRTQSATLVVGTSMLRIAALLVGIWFATQAAWPLVLVCLTALLVGRQCVFAVTSASEKEATT